MHRRPVRHRLAVAGQQRQAHVEPVGGRMQRLGEQPLAACDVTLVELRRHHIQRAALADAAGFGNLVLHMQAAHANLDAERRNQQPVTDRDPAREHRAGDDGADAGQRERSIDCQAEMPAAAPAPQRRGGGAHQVFLQIRQALAGDAGHRQHLEAGTGGAGQHPLHFVQGGRASRRVDTVYLGQRHHAFAQAQLAEDGQVLQCLRHRAIVGGNDEQHMVDAGHSGQHVVDEFFVPRHVDEAEHAAAGQRLVGIAEIDGDAARFFFLQAIGVHAGQCLDQRCLAVVDVTCGAHDHAAVLFTVCRSAEKRARASTGPRGAAGRAAPGGVARRTASITSSSSFRPVPASTSCTARS